VKIFTADIIYNLFDSFTEYVKQCVDARKDTGGSSAVFPCVLMAIKENVFNSKAPLIMGVEVKSGILKIGTPVCIPEKENLKIGVVQSIEKDKKNTNKAVVGDKVAVRIEGQPMIQFGRHFDETN
jgi:translation initiation factor 5B